MTISTVIAVVFVIPMLATFVFAAASAGGRSSSFTASLSAAASTVSLSDLLHDSWHCDLDAVSEIVHVPAPSENDGRLLEIHVRSNVKVNNSLNSTYVVFW